MFETMTRLLLAAGILIGTTYLPVLSQALIATQAAPQGAVSLA
jgi:hypothetical protein